jgi:hypothetical protein
VPYAVVAASVRRVDVVFVVDVPEGTQARQEDPAEVVRLGWFAPASLPEVSAPTADILRALRVL